MSDRSLNEWHGVETDADGRVTSLDLSASQLTGEIPSELGSLVNLRTLDLSADQLIGCVPSGLRDIGYNDLHLLELPDCR